MTRSIPEAPPKPKRRRVQTPVGTRTKTEQQHENECNINTIMRKMHAQGIIPHYETGGNFGDFTSIDDFQTAQNRIIAANNDFMALPAELRAKFDNDPGQLLQFLENPDNREACQEMGLLAPPGHLQEPTHGSPQDKAERPPEAAQEPVTETAPKGKNT